MLKQLISKFKSDEEIFDFVGLVVSLIPSLCTCLVSFPDPPTCVRVSERDQDLLWCQNPWPEPQ